MADRDEYISEGSDIDEYYSSDEDNLDAENAREDRNIDPLDRAQMMGDGNILQWLEEDDPSEDHPFDRHDGWQYDTDNFRDTFHHPCNIENENPGVHDDMLPHEIFNLYWDKRPVFENRSDRDRIDQRPIWSLLLEETNRYAEADQQARPPPRRWSPLNLCELQTWVGLCLAMGVMKLPGRRDYWKKQYDIFTTQFGKFMARDRFDLIWR